MKINPVSIVTWPRFDHMIKTVFYKNEETGAVKVENQSFPIYNSKGKIVEPVTQGNKVDITV